MFEDVSGSIVRRITGQIRTLYLRSIYAFQNARRNSKFKSIYIAHRLAAQILEGVGGGGYYRLETE